MTISLCTVGASAVAPVMASRGEGLTGYRIPCSLREQPGDTNVNHPDISRLAIAIASVVL